MGCVDAAANATEIDKPSEAKYARLIEKKRCSKDNLFREKIMHTSNGRFGIIPVFMFIFLFCASAWAAQWTEVQPGSSELIGDGYVLMGVAVGGESIYIWGPGKDSQGQDTLDIRKSINGGKTFGTLNAAQLVPEAQIFMLTDMSFASEDFGLAAAFALGAASIYKITNGGNTWTPILLQSNPLCSLAYCLDTTHCWFACNDAEILSSHDGAAQWESASLGNEELTVNDLFFLDGSTGWAVGGKETTDDNTGETTIHSEGGVYKTTDGGKTWSALSSKEKRNYHDIQMISTTFGYAIVEEPTSSGSIYQLAKTTDGGRTWTPTPVISSHPQSGQALFVLSALHFFDDQHGWLFGGFGAWDGSAGNEAALLETTDGGQTWSVHAASREDGNAPRGTYISGAEIVSEEWGIAVGDFKVVLRLGEGTPPADGDVDGEGEEEYVPTGTFGDPCPIPPDFLGVYCQEGLQCIWNDDMSHCTKTCTSHGDCGDGVTGCCINLDVNGETDRYCIYDALYEECSSLQESIQPFKSYTKALPGDSCTSQEDCELIEGLSEFCLGVQSTEEPGTIAEQYCSMTCESDDDCYGRRTGCCIGEATDGQGNKVKVCQFGTVCEPEADGDDDTGGDGTIADYPGDGSSDPSGGSGQTDDGGGGSSCRSFPAVAVFSPLLLAVVALLLVRRRRV